jgi:serine protein kinase
MSDNTNSSSFLDGFKENYELEHPKEMSMGEYLDLCKEDKGAYASAAERLLNAIGEPELVETAKDPVLSRIHQNKVIERYPAFDDFYGAEETISKIVGHLRSAAQGVEEKKQVLYLLGPVGGGKSSIAERLKEIMETEPFYVLKHIPTGEISPVFESPLGLFNERKHGDHIKEEFGIDQRYIKPIPSPWALKRFEESKGDINDFGVVKMYPSVLNQIGITKTEPGDENNQDISALTGKVDIRKLEDFPQEDADAYSYSGGLCRASQGLMEFVEMFKAPIKVLNPLLTATQEGHYNGTEAIGAMPFSGVVLAHSNESEWESFRNNNRNEAFIDRVNIIKVPYCLSVRDEKKIYEKLISNSDLAEAPCAPKTLDMMAEFSVLSRLKKPANSNIISKMKVYNGENLKESDPKAKPIQEYKNEAGQREGMDGSSTRFAFKILSKTFNFEAAGGGEIAADPVHLMSVLKDEIDSMDLPDDARKERLGFIDEYLLPSYRKFIDKEIKTAYLENSAGYGQELFDKYLLYADMWLQDQEYRDPHTGDILNREALDAWLKDIERPSNIPNVKDFRNDVVNFALRHRAKPESGGKNPEWKSYNKLKRVLEAKMFVNSKDMMPVISFGPKSSKEDQARHDGFVNRMAENGYTEKQTRFLCEWASRQP